MFFWKIPMLLTLIIRNICLNKDFNLHYFISTFQLIWNHGNITEFVASSIQSQALILQKIICIHKFIHTSNSSTT